MPTKLEPAFDMDLEKELDDQVHALIGGRAILSRANIRKARRLMRKWPAWMAGIKGTWVTFIASRRLGGQIVD